MTYSERMPVPSDLYDATFFPVLDSVQDKHYWFRARARILEIVVRQIAGNLSEGGAVLEIGCGNGGTLHLLQRSLPETNLLVGMDLHTAGLALAKRRVDCPLIQADLRRPPFATPFELIGLFDVLEHIPDDVAALARLREMLKEGGVPLLTVPAHAELWSYFDVASRHRRRYGLEELHNKLRETGFVLDYLTHFMALLYPLVRLGRRINALRGAESQGESAQLANLELKVVPVLNAVLSTLLRSETFWVARRRRMPTGTSLLAVARRAV